MPTLNIHGIDLYYETAGPIDAPVVVFSHSVGCSLEIWDAQFAALSKRYRCVRYDLRSHGRSQAVDVETSIDDLANDLRGLLDALDIDKAHIVGLSIGGMLGQAFAVAHPERVISLGLVSTTAYLPPLDFWQARADSVRAEGMEPIADGIMPRWFTESFLRSHADVVKGYRDRLAATDPAGYGRCCVAIGTMDIRDRIGAITAPTLIIVGDVDPATPPAMAEDIRQRIAGSEMVVISGASHIVSVEKPDAVTSQLTGFLARHDGMPSDGDFTGGLGVRRSVLGDAYVDRAFDRAGPFAMPWQEFITRYAWGEIWGDETLPRKTRSLLTLAMMIALHREEEFKIHIRPALGNDVTIKELRALIFQAAIYAGVPASNAAFRWVREEIAEEIAAYENQTG